MDFWAAFLAGLRRLVRMALRATLAAAALLAAVGYAVGGLQGVRNGMPWSLVAGFAAFLGGLTAVVIDVADRDGPLFALDDWNGQG